jgi:hypothetical protein
MCILRRTTNQLCSNNTDTPIQFGTADVDTDTMATTGASAKITIKTAGVYQISWNLSWDNIGTGVATAFFAGWVRVNTGGQRYAQHLERAQSSFEVRPRYSGALMLKLSVNDTLELVARQEGYGAGVNVRADTSGFGEPQLSATWVGNN